MFDPHRYTITIRQAEFDGEILYEARVKELPDIAEFSETHEEAYALALDAIATTAEIFEEKGRAMPEPLDSEEDYSGRITLRLPKSLHRRLAERADEEAVSLNQYMVSILAHHGGVLSAANSRANEIL